MRLTPGTLDYSRIEFECHDVREGLCVRSLCTYAEGETEPKPVEESRSQERLRLRINATPDLRRAVFGSTIVRSDGSAHGSPSALEYLVTHYGASNAVSDHPRGPGRIQRLQE